MSGLLFLHRSRSASVGCREVDWFLWLRGVCGSSDGSGDVWLGFFGGGWPRAGAMSGLSGVALPSSKRLRKRSMRLGGGRCSAAEVGGIGEAGVIMPVGDTSVAGILGCGIRFSGPRILGAVGGRVG
jgi:hypothetical protein